MMVLGTNMCVNVRTHVKCTCECCGEEAKEFFFFFNITMFCEEFYSLQGPFPTVSLVTSVCIFTQTANLMLPVPGETAPSHMLVHATWAVLLLQVFSTFCCYFCSFIVCYILNPFTVTHSRCYYCFHSSSTCSETLIILFSPVSLSLCLEGNSFKLICLPFLAISAIVFCIPNV